MSADTTSKHASAGDKLKVVNAAGSRPTPIKPPTALDLYKTARLGMGARATLDDLWYCYRLFLRRLPDEAGFGIFSKRVHAGMTVAELVELFRTSKEYEARQQQGMEPAPELTPISETQLTPITLNGMNLYAPTPQTPAELHAHPSESYKPHLRGLVSSVLQSGTSVLDIGAGFGAFAIAAARKAGPTGRVIALEPDVRLVRLLLANIALHNLSNIDVLPFAAADGDGFLSLVQRDAIQTSKDVTHAELSGLAETPIVYARTIDTIIPPSQKIDLIRIAIDGFDYRALLGASTLLRRAVPPIIGEYAPGLLKEFSGVPPQTYLEYLRDCGYSRFVAITQRKQGVVDMGNDISKLAAFPAQIGAAMVDFYATRD
ncbi:FkbM family methyltransferase [Hephaestia caeni]|uniref:FkbM family methyltransferase n=1 Tax=Hephaestia caeni TaxID=645617 RepID=A0A397P9S5_9SPHN|nr:FkbM family methyltransferase [Hephaestia caeni]RIA46300.1 FkbM family methyltransferase [Hephaestia caeni]